MNSSSEDNQLNGTEDVGEPAVAYMATEWVLVCLIMVVNSLTIITLVKAPTLRDNVTYGLVNLSCADLSVSFAVITCLIHDHQYYSSIFTGRKVWCSFCMVLCVASIQLSSFGLLLVAYERYTVITNPLHYMHKITPRKMKTLIVAIWIWVFSVHLMTLIFARMDDEVGCYPNLFLPWYINDLAYVVNATIPLLATIVLYIRIAVLARRQQRAIADQNSSMGIPTEKKEYKIAKMMSIVVGVYAFCWIPLITCSTMVNHTKAEDCPPELVMAQRLAYMLTMVNSFMNPVIYFWKMKNFRISLKRILGCRNATTEPLPNSDQTTSTVVSTVS